MTCSCCCVGPPEGTLEEQWQVLDDASQVLAIAPDDEIVAELLCLQGELLHQVRMLEPYC